MELLYAIIGFVIGVILSYFIDATWFRNKRICTEAEQKLKTSYDRLQVENKGLVTRADSLDGELRVANSRYTDLSAKYDTDASAWESKYSTLAAAPTGPSDLELSLKQENARLKADVDGLNSKLTAVPTGPSDLELSLKEENARLKADVDGLNAKLTAVPTGSSDLELSLKQENALLVEEKSGHLSLIDKLKAQLAEKDNEISKFSVAGGAGLGVASLGASSLGFADIDYSSDPDDLTKIWGIGPKINGVLNSAGIYKFSQLAATSSDRLTEIMENAGERFNLANQDTWPDQSALARDGKWVDLEKLQAKLSQERQSGNS